MLNQKNSDGYQLVELKKQHKEECKGLVVQIRYLKAKFTRESTLRDDLVYQKHYLLVLLSNFEARYGHSLHHYSVRLPCLQ
jgi:myosin protein heavy chain